MIAEVRYPAPSSTKTPFATNLIVLMQTAPTEMAKINANRGLATKQNRNHPSLVFWARLMEGI